MSWIKIQNGLISNKKTARLASKMKWGKLQTVGFLVSFWIWAIENCENGQLEDVEDSDIAFAVGLESADGVLSALVSSGLIDLNPCRIHDWPSHQHEFLRGKYREKPEEYRKILDLYRSNTGVTPEYSGLERKKERKIDIKKDTTADAVCVPGEIDTDTWKAYLELRTKKRATNTPHALGLIIKDILKLKTQGHNPKYVVEESVKRGWIGVFPLKIGYSAPNRDLSDAEKAAIENRAEEARLRNAK